MLTENILQRNISAFFNKGNFTYVDYPILSNGSDCCEDDRTAFLIRREGDGGLFLRQTAQVHMEYDVRSQEHNAVWTRGRSLRDEPRAGDGRHEKDFPLVEWECTTRYLQNAGYYPGHISWESTKKISGDLFYLIKFDLNFIAQMLNIYEGDDYSGKFSFHAMSYESIIENYGDDVSPELERELCGDNKIVAVYNYPTELCHFTMGQANEKECMKVDILLPGIGETIGSAVRATDREFIAIRLYNSAMYKGLVDKGMNPFVFDKYLSCDFSVPTVGGGIGVSRLMKFLQYAETL